jgi:hypothetical protein
MSIFAGTFSCSGEYSIPAVFSCRLKLPLLTWGFDEHRRIQAAALLYRTNKSRRSPGQSEASLRPPRMQPVTQQSCLRVRQCVSRTLATPHSGVPSPPEHG